MAVLVSDEPLGYKRSKCSVCGESLGFTEGNPCDRCWSDSQAQVTDVEPSEDWEEYERRDRQDTGTLGAW